jgi:hypothetical protein
MSNKYDEPTLDDCIDHEANQLADRLRDAGIITGDQKAYIIGAFYRGVEVGRLIEKRKTRK